MEAWSFANTILGWHENLASDEVPPREIWLDTKAVNEHFDILRKKWKSDGDDEAPEGTMQDVLDGKDVTLRNKLAGIAEIRSNAANDADLYEI